MLSVMLSWAGITAAPSVRESALGSLELLVLSPYAALLFPFVVVLRRLHGRATRRRRGGAGAVAVC